MNSVPSAGRTASKIRPFSKQAVGILIIILLSATRSSGQPATKEAPPQNRGNLSVSVHTGGTGRYTANRWGMMKANLFNMDSSPQSVLIVVTPAGGEGLQYARKISVPGRTFFETSWPIRIDAVETGSLEFQYLAFPGGEEDGVIHQKQNQDLLPAISGRVEGSVLGLTGWLSDVAETPESNRETSGLLRAMRFEQRGDVAVVNLIPQDITGHGECLEPLDLLAISCPDLIRNRQACESIRLWLQRGGRLLLFVDKTGPRLAEVLLGDAWPMTIAGMASANEVQLDLNPEFRPDQYPVRSVKREFDEPVHWLRILQESGDVIWSVEDWPVAIQVPVGSGTVVVTTISPAVFLTKNNKATVNGPEFSLIASSRPMTTALFTPRTAPLISEQAVALQAAAVVGYQIPTRSTAAFLTLLFPILLLTVGIVLLRWHVGQRLVWVLPILAVLSAIPSVVFGMRIRAVAPETVIETQLIRSVPGQRTLVADGYASLYSPQPSVMQVQTEQGTLLENRADAMNRDYRRQVWTSATTSHWEHLSQPTGLRTFPVRSLQKLSSGMRAVATFDEQGLRGALISEDFRAPSDLVLAGASPDCMSLTISSDGTFRGKAEDVLAPGQFFRSSLVTEEQQQRSAILQSVFSGKNRLEAFPQAASILFWDSPDRSPLSIGGENVRHMRSVLVVQPLQLESPEAGRLITIPAPLLPYRAVVDASGGYTAVFNNTKREWSAAEGPSETLLQFRIPPSCLPFDPETVRFSILIRAGSRTVKFSSGTESGLSPVTEFFSPLGAHQIDIPASLVKASCNAGHVFLQISVSDLDESLKLEESSSGEQDDSWRIERVQLTLTGRRIAVSAPAPASPLK